MASRESDRLFAGVPSSDPQSQLPTSSGGKTAWISDDDTLDEPVWKTIARDIITILKNCRSVLVPINWRNLSRDSSMRNWDLWGPLVFMLLLASTLSWGEQQASTVFALVFAEVAIGAVVLTVNVILLGGDIVFFQALCLLGYCLLPICISAIFCAIFSPIVRIKQDGISGAGVLGTSVLSWARCLFLIAGLGWAGWATIPFIGSAVSERRRALAVYPVVLMYASLGWLALVKSA